MKSARPVSRGVCPQRFGGLRDCGEDLLLRRSGSCAIQTTPELSRQGSLTWPTLPAGARPAPASPSVSGLPSIVLGSRWRAAKGRQMITGDLKSKVDRVWDAFWSGGIANPLEVMEQITYLLFLRRLDDLQTLAERKANLTKKPLTDAPFPVGNDQKGLPYDALRWSRFKDFDPAKMYQVVGERAFPFLRDIGGDGSTFAHNMRDARFTIPTAGLLTKVVDLLADLPMVDRDTKGDIYEYMLAKIATSGQNGQFRTPRHIIKLTVAMTAPTPTDTICDPACGTAGFLVGAGELLRENHSAEITSKAGSALHHKAFHGFDFDNTMLRIGSMNMLLHGVESPTSATATPLLRARPMTLASTRSCWPTLHLLARWTTRPPPRICCRW